MTTFQALKQDVNDRLVRSFADTLLNSFNRIAEAMIAREVRVRQQITRGDLTLAAVSGTNYGEADLPTGWLEFRSITLDNESGPGLTFMEPEIFFSRREAFSGEAPQGIYTIEGDKIYAAPGGTGTLKVSYYARFTALSANDDTTWLLTNHYDVHLAAILYAAADYEQDDQLMARYKAQFDLGVRALNRNDRRARISGNAAEVHGTVGP